ncbi:MAG: hypothetical protein COB40_12045 [Marinosulfonomonas sp.]|nr:MAG: hypothetical protein COB40_12045 [Marinosulfonomonas sp.]
MNNDIILVFGVIIGVLAIPSLISAFSAGRSPRAATVLFMVGGAMVSWVIIQQPNTYSVENFPDVFVKVVAKIIR